MSVAVVCLAQTDNLCGESPVWDPREQALYWVDIYRPTLWRYDPATRQTRAKKLARLVGSIGLRAAGGLIAATSEGFATLSPDTGELTALPRHAPDAPRYRFNDGKCDRAGRFWAGTVDTTNYAAVGELFRLDPDGSTHFCASDLVTPNGMAFAPDDRTMYLADSRREIVYAYEFDLKAGAVGDRRVFASTAGSPARVDGATVDGDGDYWCAHVRDWHIARYAPDGALRERIRMPVEHPLMCTFGGRDLDVLYVTSGSFLLTDPAQRAAQPLAGALFAITGLGRRGLAEPFCSYDAYRA